MRLFAAIKVLPDEAFLQQVRKFRDTLHRDKIKWVETNNIHITLKFFGETSQYQIPSIYKALSRVAVQTPSFSFHLEGLGIFGSRYQPRVIWAGINPYEDMLKLMRNTHDALFKEGFPRETQNSVPHLTLGRIKQIADKKWFDQSLDRFRNIRSEEQTIAEIVLFESILKPTGPVYHTLQTFPLP